VLPVVDLTHQGISSASLTPTLIFWPKGWCAAFAQPIEACSGCEGFDY
jgi:hypothetical protein